MPSAQKPLPPKLKARLDRLKRQMLGIEIALQGSLTERFMPCGRKGCHCQADPAQLHGPYYQWTTKIDGKTKTIRVKKEDLEDFEGFIAEGRRLEECIREWRALSLEAVEQGLGSVRS